jgi:hypothetical protein
MVGRRMMATAEPPLLPPFPKKNEGSSPGDTSEGDGRQVATLARIVARRVRRLVANGQSKDNDPWGVIVARRGRSTPSIAAMGGGLPAR